MFDAGRAMQSHGSQGILYTTSLILPGLFYSFHKDKSATKVQVKCL